jgi:hypothetical protein
MPELVRNLRLPLVIPPNLKICDLVRAIPPFFFIRVVDASVQMLTTEDEQQTAGIGAGEEEGGNQEEMQVPRLTPQEVEARRRAFPDLYKFLDKFEGINRGPSAHDQPAMQMQREEKKKVHSKLARFADEEETEEDEERWDESVLFDAPLATTAQQRARVSP